MLNLSDGAVIAELGRRIERTRLERNLTQRQLAAEAGVERKALQRIEAGQSVHLTTFLRLLRALGLIDGVDQLVPEPTASPIDQLRRHDRERRRASGTAEAQERAPDATWRWGDEEPDGDT
jgi:transcriptional regulator with XRE-family HTH domain